MLCSQLLVIIRSGSNVSSRGWTGGEPARCLSTKGQQKKKAVWKPTVCASYRRKWHIFRPILVRGLTILLAQGVPSKLQTLHRWRCQVSSLTTYGRENFTGYNWPQLLISVLDIQSFQNHIQVLSPLSLFNLIIIATCHFRVAKECQDITAIRAERGQPDSFARSFNSSYYILPIPGEIKWILNIEDLI